MFKELTVHDPDLTEQLHRVTQKPIRCKYCGAVVTDKDKQLAVNGLHIHSGTNPAGIVFVFSCFKEARGCRTAGIYTAEHTWFPQHEWSLAFCTRCQNHLGWHFKPLAAQDSFFGLIRDRLTGL